MMLDLAQYEDADDRLSRHVPWDFFVAPGVFRNKDGSLTRCFEFRGRDLDSSEDAELLGACRNLSAILGQFRTLWCHHIEVDHREVSGHPEPTAADPVARAVDAERHRQFTLGRHMDSRFYHSITMHPPSERIQRIKRFFTKGNRRKVVDAYRDLIEPFTRTTGVYGEILGQSMAWTKALDDHETVTYLHACVSPHRRHKVNATRYEGWPIECDVMDTPFTKGSTLLMVDRKADWHIRTIDVLGYPETSYPGMLDALDKLMIEYRFVQRFICLSDADAGAILHKIWKWRDDNKYNWREFVISKTLDKSRVVEPDAVQARHALEAQAAREEAEYGGVASGWLTPTVTVWDRDQLAVEEKADKILECFRDRNFACNVAVPNAFQAWQSSLPGEVRANVRKRPLPNIHMVNMLPLSAPWAGPRGNARLKGPTLMRLETAGGRIFRFDHHYGDTGNAFYIAPVRVGKSTLHAVSGTSFQRYAGAQIYSLDVDADYSAIGPACLLTGGDVITFARNEFALQPFADVGEDEDEFLFWHDWCMVTLQAQGVIEKSKLSSAQASDLVKRALQVVALQPRHLRDVDLFQAALQHPDLKAGFADYCGNGPYAAFVNAKSDRISRAHWVTFELTALAGKPKAVQPIVLALLRKIWQRLDGRPTLVQIDEAWLALREIPEQLGEMLRRFPKRNASVVLATHSLHDIGESRIAAVLKENCKTRVFLANAEAVSEAGVKILRDYGYNGQQAKIIANLAPKRDLYVCRPDGARVCQLKLGPLAKAVCGAGGEDDAMLMRRLLAEHGREGFRPAWFRAKGFPQIANRLERGGSIRDLDLAA